MKGVRMRHSLIALCAVLLLVVLLRETPVLERAVLQPEQLDTTEAQPSGRRDLCADGSVVVSDSPDGISTNVIREFEGIVPTLYQPADMSGPTIGVGLDLGGAGEQTIRATLGGLVRSADLDTMLHARGMHGAEARAWIAKHRDLRLDSCVIDAIVRRQCIQYWRYVVGTRPWMATAPSGVKTAALSFYMHFGTLDPFSAVLQRRDWQGLADEIEVYNDSTTGEMAENWKRRRHLEAKLIRTSLGRNIVVSPD